MRVLSLSFVLSCSVLVSSLVSAVTLVTEADKDASILREGEDCLDCPHNACGECMYGTKDTLHVHRSPDGWGNALIGFHMPVEGSQVQQCFIHLPLFLAEHSSNFVVTVSTTTGSFWDEHTVSNITAPAYGSVLGGSINVPPNAPHIEPIDATEACQNAVNGEFSVYISVYHGEFKLPSRESNGAAQLHIATKEA
ncbi:hypothetical protein GGF46_003908 [Coemansia sp. RSA 552]|nr:hypothetical protein GGF46_003908 [Coemansia sp. RSA 552]